jgi:membrane associated rhomboid family serine protease
MLIPVKDDNPLLLIRFQYVTAALIIINVLIFAVTGGFVTEATLAAVATGFGVIPIELFTGTNPAPHGFDPIAEPLTLITYQFLHGSWLHLFSNMIILWILGDNIEDNMGHVGFLAFYLLCGVAAGLAHALMSPGSNVPLVGASGAIAGVMGAYMWLYPRARILVLFSLIIPFRVPAWVFLGGWLVLQFLSLRAPVGAEQAVAWWAHIGGFVAGLVLTLLWPRQKFDTTSTR